MLVIRSTDGRFNPGKEARIVPDQRLVRFQKNSGSQGEVKVPTSITTRTPVVIPQPPALLIYPCSGQNVIDIKAKLSLCSNN
jgi:hypothetical protein